MKSILRLVLSLTCITIAQACESIAQNFYPLDSANTWSYRVYYNNWPNPADSTASLLAVTRDTLMPNGYRYRRLSRPDPLGALFVRTDSTHVYYYSTQNNSDVPVFNLLSVAGTTDTIRWVGLFTSSVTAIGTQQVLGRERTIRHYNLGGIVFFEATLADGFGIIDAIDKANNYPWPYRAHWSLRGCVIRDTLYGTLLDVSKNESLPAQYILHQNYPNPFNPSTTITFEAPVLGRVRLAVKNILGQDVAQLFDGEASPGKHRVTFDASDFSSGVYVYVLSTPNSSLQQKMLFIK